MKAYCVLYNYDNRHSDLLRQCLWLCWGDPEVSVGASGQTIKTESGLFFDCLFSSISGQNTCAICHISNLFSLRKDKKKVCLVDEKTFIEKSS